MPPSSDAIAKMTVPVLGLYGAADDAVTPTVSETEISARAAGKTYVAKIYAGATHGFVPRQEAGGGGPNATAAADAWREMLTFLRSRFN
jgi:dienelactone hydrolase